MSASRLLRAARPRSATCNQKISEGLALRIAVASGGAIYPEDMRPDVDWSQVRLTLMQNQAEPRASQTKTATQPVAQEV